MFIDKIYVGSTGDKINTAAASLDLTQTPLVFGNPSITSTNATGTTFTVADVTTGLHVVGGTGDDTLILQGLSFTAGQRDAIFALGSVEHIIDASGPYQATPATSLTTDPDLIVADPVTRLSTACRRR